MRLRWDIEPFFKFLKQHLNLTHLVSRNINGISVMIYMTLILAMLLIVYKKLNKISSYKIAKLRFTLELDEEIMKQVAILCGGDPKKVKNLFNDS
ncbi:MAG: transposase [Chitinophagales bacterium]